MAHKLPLNNLPKFPIVCIIGDTMRGPRTVHALLDPHQMRQGHDYSLFCSFGDSVLDATKDKLQPQLFLLMPMFRHYERNARSLASRIKILNPAVIVAMVPIDSPPMPIAASPETENLVLAKLEHIPHLARFFVSGLKNVVELVQNVQQQLAQQIQPIISPRAFRSESLAAV